MEIDTYVGLDISKNSIMATAVDPLGHRLRQEKLVPSDEELRQFLLDLPRHQARSCLRPVMSGNTSMMLRPRPVPRFCSPTHFRPSSSARLR